MFKKMTIGVALLAAIMSGGVTVELQAQDTAKTTLAAAGRALKTAVGKEGDERTEVLESARAIYKQVPIRWPDEAPAVAQAHLQMARLSKRLGDLTEALRQLDLVVAVKGEARKHAVAYVEMAKIASKAKQPDEAIAKLQALLDNCSDCRRDCADALLRLSSIHAGREQFDKATASARKVIDTYPEVWRANVDACNQVCRILISRREWVKAIDRLTAVDQLLEERFASTDAWESVQSAMQRMSSRRVLTPWQPTAVQRPSAP